MLISSLVISILNTCLVAYLLFQKKKQPTKKIGTEVLTELIYDFENHGYSIIRISPDSILYRRLP